MATRGNAVGLGGRIRGAVAAAGNAIRNLTNRSGRTNAGNQKQGGKAKS